MKKNVLSAFTLLVLITGFCVNGGYAQTALLKTEETAAPVKTISDQSTPTAYELPAAPNSGAISGSLAPNPLSTPEALPAPEPQKPAESPAPEDPVILVGNNNPPVNTDPDEPQGSWYLKEVQDGTKEVIDEEATKREEEKINSQIAAAQITLDASLKEMDALTSKEVRLNNQLSSIDKSIKDQENRIAVMQGAIDSRQKQIDQIYKNIADIEALAAAKGRPLFRSEKSRIATMLKTIARLENEKKTVLRNIGKAQNLIAVYKSNKSKVDAELAALTRKINVLAKKINDLNSAIAALNTEKQLLAENPIMKTVPKYKTVAIWVENGADIPEDSVPAPPGYIPDTVA